MVSWPLQKSPQGAITYGLLINGSQMSTAAASARSWLVSYNHRLILHFVNWQLDT